MFLLPSPVLNTKSKNPVYMIVPAANRKPHFALLGSLDCLEMRMKAKRVKADRINKNSMPLTNSTSKTHKISLDISRDFPHSFLARILLPPFVNHLFLRQKNIDSNECSSPFFNLKKAVAELFLTNM